LLCWAASFGEYVRNYRPDPRPKYHLGKIIRRRALCSELL
jgi:hypothetical protein